MSYQDGMLSHWTKMANAEQERLPAPQKSAPAML
jgi:hypothetical protein